MAQTFAEMIKNAREEKGLSIRKLANLCDISHTELLNIESGIRIKPGLLTLKGFEKHLGLNFESIAKMVGYSDSSIDFAEEKIIVTYDKYVKMLQKVRDDEEKLKDNIKNKNLALIQIVNDINKLTKKLDSINTNEIKAELTRIIDYVNDLAIDK